MQGKLKWYNGVNGYGFITNEGRDYFFHHSDLKIDKGAKKRLADQADIPVEFEPVETARGTKAANVRLAVASAPAAA